MDNERYREYLQSDKWKQIARQRAEIDGYQCACCGCKGTTANPLECHHLSYQAIYNEERRIYEDLVTLCHICHKQIHQTMNRITNAQGRRGWKDNSNIPQVHTLNLGGFIEYKEG